MPKDFPFIKYEGILIIKGNTHLFQLCKHISNNVNSILVWMQCVQKFKIVENNLKQLILLHLAGIICSK